MPGMRRGKQYNFLLLAACSNNTMAIILHKNYPHLFRETTWLPGPIQVKFVLSENLPPVHQISNVNVIPHIQKKWITIRLKDRTWEIPGGTLEPGEDYLCAARRELLEEVGAKLISFRLIGAWHCISLADKPYRAHLPFPEHYRIVGIGDVEIIKTPENPIGAEDVYLVDVGTVESSIKHFSSSQRYDLAELYKLAFDIERLKYQFNYFI